MVNGIMDQDILFPDTVFPDPDDFEPGSFLDQPKFFVFSKDHGFTMFQQQLMLLTQFLAGNFGVYIIVKNNTVLQHFNK